jgi:transcriptional regulator of acetoin/glycerol metabolism
LAAGLTDDRIAAGILLDLLDGAELRDAAPDGLAEAERGALRRALLRNRGNVTATARDLGLSRATIKRKLRDHGLSRSRPEAAEARGGAKAAHP